MNGIETKHISDWVKGVSIIVVMLSHLAPAYFPGMHFFFWGNHFVSFFFLLSGYGLLFSLDRLTKSKQIIKGILSEFYLKRFLRIFPLYWFWFFFVYEPKSTQDAYLVFFCIDFIKSPLWFVNAIVQCYLISPLLYYFIVRFRFNFLIFITILFLFINVLMDFIGVPCLPNLAYRGLFFLHIYFFAIGMVLPMVKFKAKSNPFLILLVFLVFLLSCDLTSCTLSDNNFCFRPWKIIWIKLLYFNVNIYNFLFILFSTLLTLLLLNFTGQLPFSKLLTLFGNYSYPLYIFHGFYFGWLKNLGLISLNSHINWIPIFIFFPLFFLFCKNIQLYFSNFGVAIIASRKSKCST